MGFWWAGLGLVVGLAVGFSVGWRRRRSGRRRTREVDGIPQVSSQLETAVDLMHSAALIAGPNGEALHVNSLARAAGLVRGGRAAPDELVQLIKSVWARRGTVGTVLQLKRDVGSSSGDFAVHLSVLEGGVVLVVADDRTANTKADEIKRDFVANVSHELKTPVGAIQVLSEAIQQAADDPQAVTRFATRMTRETERLAELVQQIIELSRLQSLDPLIHADVVDMGELVSSGVNRCRELAMSSRVELTYECGSQMQVIGDRSQLMSALVNLVINGINYSGAGAKVSVDCRVVEDGGEEHVELSVTDNGVGIRADDLDRIFERFYRVDYDRSRRSGGNGLGLSIVKHVVDAHGGSVNVWSTVGQGSTFTLRLPVFLEPEE